MKKIAFFIFIMYFSFISSNTWAEWTIPGTRCIPISQNGEVYYSNSGIYNNNIRLPGVFVAAEEVLCSSPVYHSYGSKLDMDFITENNSKDRPFFCIGYSLDIKGNIVQETAMIEALPIYGRTTATEAIRHSNAKPVTVVARCIIPDRRPGRTDHESRLFGVKVY